EVLRFHPLADIFPLIGGEEFDALVDDIKKHGPLEKIVQHENMILDGRNRYRACEAAGVPPRLVPFEGDDPAAFVITQNIHRRHLTGEQRCELIAKLLAARPEASNASIAKIAKADDKTVAAVRREKEATSQIPRLEKRLGADGKARKRPARKQPKKTKPAAA